MNSVNYRIFHSGANRYLGYVMELAEKKCAITCLLLFFIFVWFDSSNLSLMCQKWLKFL